MNVYGLVRLTADPELRYNQAGTAFSNFNVAWNTGFGDNKKASFIKCTVAGKSAEVVQKNFTKGRMIFIKSGELQQKQWKTQDGQKKSNFEIFVKEWGFAGDGNVNKDKNDNMDVPPPSDLEPINLDDLPF
jgi:single-strand DNA-binding protein